MPVSNMDDGLTEHEIDLTISALFAIKPYWTKQEMMAVMSLSSEHLNPVLDRYCFFLNTGPRRNHFILRPTMQ